MSPEEYSKRREWARKEAEGLPMIKRLCWRCKGSNDYLKDSDSVVNCAVGCGNYYYKGTVITPGT